MKNLLLSLCFISVATRSVYGMEEENHQKKEKSKLEKIGELGSFRGERSSEGKVDIGSITLQFDNLDEEQDPQDRSLLSDFKDKLFKKEGSSEEGEEIKQVVKLKEKKDRDPWKALGKADPKDIQIISVEGDVTRNYHWGDGDKQELQKKLLNAYSAVSLDKNKVNVNIDLKKMDYKKPPTLKDKLLDTTTLVACAAVFGITYLLASQSESGE